MRAWLAALAFMAGTACATPSAVKLNVHLPGVRWSCDALRLLPSVPPADPAALGPVIALHCVIIDTRRQMLIDVLMVPISLPREPGGPVG